MAGDGWKGIHVVNLGSVPCHVKRGQFIGSVYPPAYSSRGTGCLISSVGVNGCNGKSADDPVERIFGMVVLYNLHRSRN